MKSASKQNKFFKIQRRNSSVHGSGVFAKEAIPRGATVVEYRGEKISKKEGDRRALKQFDKSRKSDCAAAFIFNLNQRYDLDGNIPNNVAKYINHSCEPNCSFVIDRGKVLVKARRRILPEEELSVDYGFDIEDFTEHPCYCSSESCVGYIVKRPLWRRLKKMLAIDESNKNN